MPHQVTVTAKTGPDRQVTGAVLTGVDSIVFNLNDKVVQIFQETPNAGNNVKEFDLATVTTVTFTITAGNYAVVIA